MNNVIIAIFVTVVTLFFMGAFAMKSQIETPKSCYTFQRTDTSHIRLNSCTGEAHVIVRGVNGFEWQRVIE